RRGAPAGRDHGPARAGAGDHRALSHGRRAALLRRHQPRARAAGVRAAGRLRGGSRGAGRLARRRDRHRRGRPGDRGAGASGAGGMTDASARRQIDGATPPFSLAGPKVLRRRPMVLITGGSGFVGANLADRLAASGERVLIYDNLSRPNVRANLEWLQRRHGHRIETAIADVRDADALCETMRQASAVYHLAAQVAVTTSLDDPLTDFEVNARGTLNVLEAARRHPDPPPLIFASTNKVYGEPFVPARLVRERTRYRPADRVAHAVAEDCPLGLCSPYGCSKGAADAYVLDYARVFGLRSVVFRMSCLYGPRQFGTEDQGWVAHFLIRARRGEPVTIFGDGRQVRDLLYIDDAVDAYLRART